MNLQESRADLQTIRELVIRELAISEDSTLKAKEIAEDLFALDLTVYSRSYSFDSILYNSMAVSALNEEIFLHPEQMKIINEIEKNEAMIISAPTSFGKTFAVFEYIARVKPNQIVLIVPTLALVDEYLKKIIRKFREGFSDYKIHINLDEDKKYDFQKKNIFILTHDKVVSDSSYKLIKEIDFMVIDEVYKLQKDMNNDRVLVLNLAYLKLSQLAKKYVLLAPFISDVLDKEKLEKGPIFYKSNYSPVVNEVIIKEIISESDRFPTCMSLMEQLGPDAKTLIYFPTVTKIYSFIKKSLVSLESKADLPKPIQDFLVWAKEEIHEEWYLVKAMERGFLVHNGQLPVGIRLLQMNLYENHDDFNRMICTSTLLEGVNTSAENIIITKAARGSQNGDVAFSSFDFYNLVGRTGRLYEHFLGTAYYIKSPNDLTYDKDSALASIKFEITDDSEDIDIQNGDIEENEIFMGFLNDLGITYDDYMENLGQGTRFSSILYTYNNYLKNESDLISEINNLKTIPKHSRYGLLCMLHRVIEGKENKFEVSLINLLLNKQRFKIKTVINKMLKYKKYDIDYLISTVIRLKNSYIEYKFYSRLNIIRYFMCVRNVDQSIIEVLDEKVIHPIDYLYFSDSKTKKMLISLGIYERDVNNIIKIIGEDFEDANDMRNELRMQYPKIIKRVSYLSRYVINNLIQ